MAGLNTQQIKDRARQVLGREISEAEAQTILSSAWDQSQFGADESSVMQMLQSGSGSSRSGNVPTADEILASSMDKIKEQVTFLKDFMGTNPFAFDEALARQMATEKYKPYYTEVLSDYVKPLETKIQRSSDDENKLLGELVRQTDLGKTKITRDMQDAIDLAQEGFAGANLLGSGIANRALGKTGIEGNENLQDYTARSDYQQQNIKTGAERERSDLQLAIDQKNRDILGTGRELDSKVAQDVEAQRGQKLRTSYNQGIMAVTDRFGTPSAEAGNYLKSYLDI